MTSNMSAAPVVPNRSSRKRPRKRTVSWADSRRLKLVTHYKFRQADLVTDFTRTVFEERRKKPPFASIPWQRPKCWPKSVMDVSTTQPSKRGCESEEREIQRLRARSLLQHPSLFKRASPSETEESLKPPDPRHQPEQIPLNPACSVSPEKAHAPLPSDTWMVNGVNGKMPYIQNHIPPPQGQYHPLAQAIHRFPPQPTSAMCPPQQFQYGIQYGYQQSCEQPSYMPPQQHVQFTGYPPRSLRRKLG